MISMEGSRARNGQHRGEGDDVYIALDLSAEPSQWEGYVQAWWGRGWVAALLPPTTVADLHKRRGDGQVAAALRLLGHFICQQRDEGDAGGERRGMALGAYYDGGFNGVCRQLFAEAYLISSTP